MSGYVVDDLALIAGLTSNGSECHRRELSRLLHRAAGGGPVLDVPALCLAAAAVARPAISDHLADIVAAAPFGSFQICGLARTEHLDGLVARHSAMSWPATHAAARAIEGGLPVVTLDRERYSGMNLVVLTL